jgi:hypothetical protein
MRSLGIATTVVLALALVAFLAVMLVSLPDLARYRRLRRM